MLAIDTNVIIRVLAGDHPSQSVAARNLVDASEVFVPTTVLLECEWVLRSTYGLKAAEICDRLRAFLGLSTVEVEDNKTVFRAIALYETGMDFADALHLQSSERCEALVTFDRNFAKRAKQANSVEVRLL